MNMMAVSCGETTLVIDAGVMFPGPELLGVDLIVPDLTYLHDRRVAALVLTHGHEDHIGGVPYLLREKVDIPLVGSRFTLALIEAKLREHRIKPYTYAASASASPAGSCACCSCRRRDAEPAPTASRGRCGPGSG